MMEPRYRDVKSAQIPEVALSQGVKVKIICGQVHGTTGPVRDIVTEPEYLDVSVPAGAEFHHPIRRGHTAFAYVIAGEGYFEPMPIKSSGPTISILTAVASVATGPSSIMGMAMRWRCLPPPARYAFS